MRFLRWSGYLFIVLLLLTAVVIGLGSRLPVEHRATATALIAAPREQVWETISKVEGQPRWRTGLKSVEVLPAGAEGPCWREMQGWMSMPLCVTASEAPSRRVVKIVDPALPFGGTWTYVLEEERPGATKVTITENGTTGPPMWRFVGHYVMGEDGQIKQYLRDLQGAVVAGPGSGPAR